MKLTWRMWLVASALLPAAVSAEGLAAPITISYGLTDLGGGRYRYDYGVANVSLVEPIREFTIWFDQGLFADLVLATPNPPAADWNELVVQPAPLLHDDGFYDSLAKGAGVIIGGHVSGFAVEFDWSGGGLPGSQRFDIVDPVTFETRYSGLTVPEPVTLALLAGGLALARRPR